MPRLVDVVSAPPEHIVPQALTAAFGATSVTVRTLTRPYNPTDGFGFECVTGARKLLLAAERQRFLTEQWPVIDATILRLGLTAQDLLRSSAAKER